MSSIFTKIINGEIPSYKIAEDDNFLAFLDVNPNAKGHTLCVPKQEIDKIFDIEEDLYVGLMQFSKKIAIALEKTVPCKRIGMAV
ncbi:MAG TPA: HIT domain-containing protein, partial [Flavobacterium sp.]